MWCKTERCRAQTASSSVSLERNTNSIRPLCYYIKRPYIWVHSCVLRAWIRSSNALSCKKKRQESNHKHCYHTVGVCILLQYAVIDHFLRGTQAQEQATIYPSCISLEHFAHTVQQLSASLQHARVYLRAFLVRPSYSVPCHNSSCFIHLICSHLLVWFVCCVFVPGTSVLHLLPLIILRLLWFSLSQLLTT